MFSVTEVRLCFAHLAKNISNSYSVSGTVLDTEDTVVMETDIDLLLYWEELDSKQVIGSSAS